MAIWTPHRDTPLAEFHFLHLASHASILSRVFILVDKEMHGALDSARDIARLIGVYAKDENLAVLFVAFHRSSAAARRRVIASLSTSER
jgi:hypothetical protein